MTAMRLILNETHDLARDPTLFTIVYGTTLLRIDQPTRVLTTIPSNILTTHAIHRLIFACFVGHSMPSPCRSRVDL
jgi:hypothetical protein